MKKYSKISISKQMKDWEKSSKLYTTLRDTHRDNMELQKRKLKKIC